LLNGHIADARRIQDRLLVEAEKMVAAEPTSQTFTGTLLTAWRLEASLRYLEHRNDAAAAAQRAIALGEVLYQRSQADRTVLWDLSQSLILAGRIAANSANANYAERFWVAAIKVFPPHLEGSHDWRLLDPAAQALTLLGRHEEARPLIAQLKRFGYHTTDPLAAPILDVVQLPAQPTQQP